MRSRISTLARRLMFPFVGLVALAACSSSSSTGPDSAGDGGTVPTEHPDASCLVTIANPPDEGATHLPIGTNITYSTNPPASGPHYPIWAAYKEYTTPVPRPYWVHDLEHGGVVFLYNCADPCPDVVSGLRAIVDALPDDPLCAGQGPRVRAVITPDPLLTTRVAAAAWDWTYTADCLDTPTLTDFARTHYGHGRESLCSDGTTQF